MNSRTYNYSRSLCNVFLSGIKVCYDEHFAVISRKSFTHWSFSNSISILSCTNRVDKCLQIRIRVWIAMSNINFIKIISKLKIKRKTIIIVLPFFVLLFLSVLVIANVFTISMPTIVHSFGFLSWIHKRKHTLIVQWIRFLKILNVKSISSIFSSILNSEIIPLSVWIRIVIRF